MIGLLTIYVFPKLIRGIGRNTAEKLSNNNDASNKKFDDLPSKGFSENNSLLSEKVMQTITAAKTDSIDVDDSSNFSSSCSSSFNNGMSDVNKFGEMGVEGNHHVRKTDTNYLLKDLISKEVNKIKGETDNLSNLLKEKIEAANIEGLIDKTVSGIVELKDDLMRMNEPEVYGPTAESLRKRNVTIELTEDTKGSSSSESTGVDAFLKKEIDAIKKEAVVIPAVLSNANSAK